MSGCRVEQYVYTGGVEACCQEELSVSGPILPAAVTDIEDIACKLVFIAPEIGTRSLSGHIQALRGDDSHNPSLSELRRVVSLGHSDSNKGVQLQSYNAFTSTISPTSSSTLVQTESLVKPDDVLNLQFTSGSSFSKLLPNSVPG